MKSLLGLIFLTASVASFAAEDTSVNDLQYAPNAGTLFGSTQVSHFKYDLGESNAIGQTVGYSITDRLFTSVVLSYSFTGNDDGYDALGDILFNGRYRVSSSNGSRFDLIGGVSVSPDQSKIDGDKGNNFSGGHSLRIGAEYGNKAQDRQWSLGAYYVQNLEAKTEYENFDESDTADAHGQLSFQANVLTRLSDNCFFKTVAAVNFTQKHDVDSDSGDYENPGQTIWNLGGEYQHLIGNNLYLNIGAQAYLFGKSDVGPAMLYTTGANYQF